MIALRAILQPLILFSCFYQGPAQTSTESKLDIKVGYVDCTGRDAKVLTPILVDPCTRGFAGNLSCGQSVNVLALDGVWLKIALPDGTERYIAASSVSQAKDKSVIFDAASGIPNQTPPRCASGHAPRPPRPIFTPDPDYTPEARKAHIQGQVHLVLTVNTDGRVIDAKVEKGLGYGLSEKAQEAVRKWKFEPAVVDDKPVAVKLMVEVKFSLQK